MAGFQWAFPACPELLLGKERFGGQDRCGGHGLFPCPPATSWLQQERPQMVPRLRSQSSCKDC